VRYLLGVKGVHNKLLVSAAKVTPHEVRNVIEDALERRADREADRIEVKVSDGMVILSGHVHSWAEKRAVIGAVSHAPGVVTVKDQIRISPV
jgi:osmotically-inducible protein OsmY